MSSVEIFNLGLIDFKRAWDFQKQVFQEVKNNSMSHAFIFCRHYPVITLGRKAERKNILAPEEEIKNRGIQVLNIDRGGGVTYHGPGQLTVYLVVNLNYLKKDIHWFLRKTEEMIIDCLRKSGVDCQRKEGATGAWSGDKKIASIGIAIRNWITFHGFSINIKEGDLQNFNLIRPCGMNIKMTSLESVLGRAIEPDELKNNLNLNILYNTRPYLAPRHIGLAGTPPSAADWTVTQKADTCPSNWARYVHLL